MPDLADVRVLLTGDDEADLDAVRTGLTGAIEVASGLTAAVAAMRLREFGALIADVDSVQDALALLRAARRSRPATRGIVLMPADQDPRAGRWELVEQAAFVVARHPVPASQLAALVASARGDYMHEREGAIRPGGASAASDSEATRWLLAERRLAAVLRRAVNHWSTRSQHGIEETLARGVAAVSEATREAQGSPELLLAIAAALGEVGEVEGEAA